MDIFIKTFNRPYYLDRCLASIQFFAKGKVKSVIVMDDGTQEKYLKKIQDKYSYVKIFRSEFADEKELKIKNHLEKGCGVTGLRLPSLFWKDTITKYGSDFFLLLEDDIWFNRPFDLAGAESVMFRENMELLKLFTFGNPRLTSGQKIQLADDIIKIDPKLFTTNFRFFENVIIKNPLKIISVLIKLHILDPLLKINYYTIYNVAGCIFSKDYYLYLWQDILNQVDEDQQLIKALRYYNERKPSYGYTNPDLLQTSFTSSATNMFKDINFDVYWFSHILNEAWYNGELNTVQNFDEDIDLLQIRKIIERDGKLSIAEWEKWKSVFRKQYEDVGHKIPKERHL